MKETPDCRTCGICCVSLQDNEIWAEVTMEDAERLGQRWCRRNLLGYSLMDMACRALDGAKTAFLGGIKTRWRSMRAGPLKGVSVCACVALRGSILNRVSCSVYDKRPEVCRDALNPGERQCLEVRKVFRELGEQ